jgi:hypothetical protein
MPVCLFPEPLCLPDTSELEQADHDNEQRRHYYDVTDGERRKKAALLDIWLLAAALRALGRRRGMTAAPSYLAD